MVVPGKPAIPTVNLSNDPNAPPVFGGHSWKLASHSGPYCTFGFNVLRSDSSYHWMLTAGHCIDQIALGANIYHATRLVGTRRAFAYGGAQDFGLIRLDSTAKAHPLVWVLDSGTSQHYTRGVIGTNTSYAVGNIRCFTGWKSTWTECGPITNSSVDTRYTDGTNMFDLVKFDVTPQQGDSGGPAFRHYNNYAYAAGIQSAASKDGQGYFVKWTNLPSSWNVVLRVYSPPTCPPCPI
jgi:streptogrisin B